MVKHQRNGSIDIYRFIMALCIMLYHSYHLDNIVNYPFKVGGQVFVEAFFLLTGYFVTKYVEKTKKEGKKDLKSDAIEALKYTWKKYKPFLPYTFFTVFASLIVRHIIICSDFTFSMILKGVFESLMIIRGDSNVGVLWYMAAMLPLIPIMIILLKKLPNFLSTIFAAIVVLGWYIILGRFLDNHIPFSYIRGIAGLSLGILTFRLKNSYQKIKYKKITTVLNFIMCIALVSPLVLSYLNLTNERLYIILFIVGFSICLHPASFKIPENKLTNLLKKYSFLIYIVHLNIADLICYWSTNFIPLTKSQQYISYFLMTILCVVILDMFVALITRVSSKILRKERD